MPKKKTIVAGERVSYRPGAGKRKKASIPPPKQYGSVEKLDDKTKSLLHIIFDSGERRQLLKIKVVHEDPGAGFQRHSSSSSSSSLTSSSSSSDDIGGGEGGGGTTRPSVKRMAGVCLYNEKKSAAADLVISKSVGKEVKKTGQIMGSNITVTWAVVEPHTVTADDHPGPSLLSVLFLFSLFPSPLSPLYSPLPPLWHLFFPLSPPPPPLSLA